MNPRTGISTVCQTLANVWIPLGLLKMHDFFMLLIQAESHHQHHKLGVHPDRVLKMIIMLSIRILINMSKMDQRYDWAYMVYVCRKETD